MKNLNVIHIRNILIVIFTIFILSGCATHYIDATSADPYGFWYGIWHGFCLPFVLLGKVLSWILGIFDIIIFENLKFAGQPNTGTSYFIGYIIGLFVLGSGGVF